jgi:uncharacterized protein YprB with RNaseH-like and TPR domain
MLQNTFLHLKKIGPKKETLLWENNIYTWDSLLNAIKQRDAKKFRLPENIGNELEYSRLKFSLDDAGFFARKLTQKHIWRMFPDYSDSVAYIDIETTGLSNGEITTIALYDGNEIKYYINGKNLETFADDILQYKLLVTYNGKTFDVPIIESFFHIELPQAHIDLRYILKSLGYTGGLKSCEKQIGISRGSLEGVDGYFAVLLWYDYYLNNNIKSLETLLAYNIEDVVNLETLMVFSFNKKIESLNLSIVNRLDDPVRPTIPFRPDQETVNKLKYSYSRLL